ncbi:hypothetical protein DPEC_G00298890 [Dallia pectoralis]|uniref:Uncharacterized protein n=1 Tax=Dallia pectoralis TaxID=75939 RepID=A0ACC2FG32_DALPE|nr:hypothetical protein DPEC_G00298890 [Dallia pectoralis]
MTWVVLVVSLFLNRFGKQPPCVLCCCWFGSPTPESHGAEGMFLAVNAVSQTNLPKHLSKKLRPLSSQSLRLTPPGGGRPTVFTELEQGEV